MKKDVNKRREAMATNAKRRTRKRKSKKTLHFAFLYLFVLVTGAVLCLTVFFKIENISVIGIDKYETADIINSSGINIGDNLFRIKKKESIKALTQKYHYIENIELIKKIPSSVEIHIEQYSPMGAIKKEDDKYVFFAADGKILEKGMFYIPEDIPIIKGVEVGDLEEGQFLGQAVTEKAPEEETEDEKKLRENKNKQRERIAEEQRSRLTMINYLFDAASNTDFIKFTNVDVSDSLNIVIIYENRLRLELGTESDIQSKLDSVMELIKNKLPEDARGKIFLWGKNNKMISFLPDDDYFLPDERREITEETQ